MNSPVGFPSWSDLQPMLDRAGWTLIHSLWQLAIAAGLLAVVLRLLRSARSRYLASVTGMALMAALPAVTYRTMAMARGAVPEQPAAAPIQASTEVGPAVAGANPTPTATAAAAPETAKTGTPSGARWIWRSPRSLADRLSDGISPFLPWLMPAWGLGVFALSIWNLGGWIATQRLRSLGIGPVASDLVERLSLLALRVGLDRPVRIARSALVEVPMVIGFLRPLILVPAALLSGLSPAYLEAVLAHELAHIRRNDYLVNLFQIVVETLFFYHPAVWWVSRRIREEREHCCDDVAAAVCGDSRLYARALVSVEELRPPLVFSIAATGGGGPMFRRIERLVGLRKRPRLGRSASLAAVVVSLGALLLPLGCSLVPAGGSGAGAGTMLVLPNQQELVGSSDSGSAFQTIVGIRSFDGVAFAIHGANIFFGSGDGTGVKSLKGIAVDRKFDELYLIHFVKYAADLPGTPVARFRLHYDDGTSADLQILYGAQVRTFFRTLLEADDRPTDPDSKVVWRSPPDPDSEFTSYRLFETVLHNPFPAKTVADIDVFSGTGRSCYCLVAATAALADPARKISAAVPIEPDSPMGGEPAGDLKVRVVDGSTHAPVPGALVIASLYSGESAEIDLATDAGGTASLRYPINDAGQLELTVLKQGYAMANIVWPRSSVPASYTFELGKGGSIGGIALVETGHPLSGAIVRLIRCAPNGYPYRTEIATRTGHDGRWALSGVAAGDDNFIIEVSHSGTFTTDFVPAGASALAGRGRPVSLADLKSETAVLKLEILAPAPGAPIAGPPGSLLDASYYEARKLVQACQFYRQVVGKWPSGSSDVAALIEGVDFSLLNGLQFLSRSGDSMLITYLHAAPTASISMDCTTGLRYKIESLESGYPIHVEQFGSDSKLDFEIRRVSEGHYLILMSRTPSVSFKSP